MIGSRLAAVPCSTPAVGSAGEDVAALAGGAGMLILSVVPLVTTAAVAKATRSVLFGSLAGIAANVGFQLVVGGLASRRA
jgi:hypothetical protein